MTRPEEESYVSECRAFWELFMAQKSCKKLRWKLWSVNI